MKKETIENLIDKQKVAFIASVDSEGYPNMKAMLPPRVRFGLKVFYFTSNTSSLRAAQYRADPRASIYFCDQRFFRGVMLKGRMEVLTDEKSRQLIWRPGDEMYYPAGLGDPDYCVLRFTAERGRCYGNFHSEWFEVEPEEGK